MKYDDNEIIIKDALDTIVTPNFNIDIHIKNKYSKNYKKRISIFIVACLCMSLSIFVAAETIPSFKKLLLLINSDTASVLKPIQMISEDKGIRIEVVAVGRYDNIVKMYVTVEDLIENRINEHITFLDYYGIQGTNAWGLSVIDYDEQSKKVTLLIEAESNNKINGDELTFEIDKIFYDNKEYKDYKTNIDLTKVKIEKDNISATTKEMFSWSGGSIFDSDSEVELVSLLEPNVKNIEFPEIIGNKISNIGIIDGNLHIQTWRDKAILSNSVDYYLKDLDGNIIGSEAYVGFDVDKNNKVTRDSDHPSYSEYIFKIDIEKLDEYELMGNFFIKKHLDGDWEVKFKAEDNGKVLEKSTDIQVGGMLIKKITINTFGINIFGDGDVEIFDVKLVTENNVIDVNFSSGGTEGDNIEYKTSSIYQTEKPINLDLVKSVIINGQIVEFK